MTPRLDSVRASSPLPDRPAPDAVHPRPAADPVRADSDHPLPPAFRRHPEPVPGFHLLQFLGKGEFGEVWKAAAPGDTEVALKIISLETKHGLKALQAVRMLKGVHHVHLVPVMAFWLKDPDGRIYTDDPDDAHATGRGVELIIEMGLGDKNLRDRLRECQAQGLAGIPPTELLGYLEEAARAIDYLNKPIHNLGSGPAAIQHCNIKPENLILVGGSVQVGDSGLARILGDVRVTGSGLTIPYTPPELFTQSQPSATSDQYALAVTYAELRTGRLPFDSLNPGHLIYALIQGKLNWSALPPAEADVIRRATALDPAARFPGSADMVRALRKTHAGANVPTAGLANLPTQATPPAPIDLRRLEPDLELVPGYTLVKVIGRGGFGEVWEATAPGGKHVALKVVKNLKATTGRQEFKALDLIKSVEHNHLLEQHAYWLLDDQGHVIPDRARNRPDAPAAQALVIASKLACKNLEQRLQECCRQGQAGIPVPELLGYLRQAAQAIDYLNQPRHALDGRTVAIQHRDIKPENILLVADTVKVGDFGLAKVVEGKEAQIHRDSEGLTLGYAAPEIFENRVTAWSDQYALAMTYYRLRTGTQPCAAANSLLAHLQQGPDLLLLPAAERAVLRRATDPVPENRFPTCAALMDAVTKACTASASADERRSTAAPASVAGSPPVPSTPPRAEPAPVSSPAQEPKKESANVLPQGQEAPRPAGPCSKVRPSALPPMPSVPAAVPTGESDLASAARDHFVPAFATLPLGWRASRDGFKPALAAWFQALTPPPPSQAPRMAAGPFSPGGSWRPTSTAAAIVLVAVIAAGGMVGIRSVEESLNHEIQPFIDQGQYREALARLETVRLPAALFRGGWREKIQAAWFDRVEQLVREDPTGSATREAARHYRRCFPEDRRADRLFPPCPAHRPCGKAGAPKQHH